MMKVRVAVIAALSIALWFGTSRFGLIGAITVVVAFNLIERLIIAARVGRILGITGRDVGLLRDIGKLGGAAFAAATVTWIVRSYAIEAPPLVALTACGIVFSVVYVVVVLLLGVLTPEERGIIERRFANLPRLSWRRTAVPLAGGGTMSVGYGVWNREAVAPASLPREVVATDFTRNPSAAIEAGELTERCYWNLTHINEKEFWDKKNRSSDSSSGALPLKRRIKAVIKKVLGKRLLAYMGSYEQHLLWNVIYEKYLPKTKGAKVLEVGSAPGDYLVKLSETFNFVPYGIEYTDSGVELNRQVFAENNINPENVIRGDFLSDEFHKLYKDRFDMVISRGFIEHFTDAKGIVEKHLNLLTDGGILVVSIPNLRGVNFWLARIFHKELIAMHNLTIMRKQRFRELFDKSEVSKIFCDYYGTFNFGLFNAPEDSPLQPILRMCMKFQLLLNAAFRLFLRERGAESPFFSPSLIFIGVKRGEGIEPVFTGRGEC
jgi:SAM-dependent methyltransferase